MVDAPSAPVNVSFNMQKNFNSVMSSSATDNDLRDQVSLLRVENTELKKDKDLLAKELNQAKDEGKDDDTTKRELEELKKQIQLKKGEYSKNLQFAKSRMEILKEQIEKLKIIV